MGLTTKDAITKAILNFLFNLVKLHIYTYVTKHGLQY
jgi:hypothetical protein